MEKLPAIDQVLEKRTNDTVDSDGATKEEEDYGRANDFETQVSEALNAKNGTFVHNLIEGTRDKSHLKAVATNSVMMKFLMMTLVGDSLNDCLDRLYEHVTHVDVLTRCIAKRFGIDVEGNSANAAALLKLLSPPRSAVKWGLDGAKRVYACLLRLPSVHVQGIKVVITTYTSNTAHGAPSASGGTHQESGSIYIDYNEVNPDAIVGSAYCDSPNDVQYHLPALDSTLAHEIGHLVDAGEKYSGSPDFRAISDWEDKGSPYSFVALREAIEECAKEPYPKSLTPDELTIAQDGAALMIMETVTAPHQIKREVLRAYHALGKDIEGQAGVRNSLALTKELESCTVYKHILRSWLGKEPWLKGMRTDMKRQIHQGGKNGVWYAFDNTAYDKKISNYQLCNPGEEFAELYSAYHVAEPKGKGLKPAHKKWFEKMNLHRNPPKDGDDA